jgi:hypothetical protein
LISTLNQLSKCEFSKASHLFGHLLIEAQKSYVRD